MPIKKLFREIINSNKGNNGNKDMPIIPYDNAQPTQETIQARIDKLYETSKKIVMDSKIPQKSEDKLSSKNKK